MSKEIQNRTDFRDATFHIKYGENSTGTAFMVNLENKNYLLTASHLVSGIKNNDIIYVYRYHRWVWYNVRLLYQGDHSQPDQDLAILEVDESKTPLLGSKSGIVLEPFEQDWELGGEVNFFGFPLSLTSINPDRFPLRGLNTGFPLPFLKSGKISTVGITDTINNRINLVYLDAHVNGGFSGGPVCKIVKDVPSYFGMVTSSFLEQIDPENRQNAGIAVCIVLRNETFSIKEYF